MTALFFINIGYILKEHNSLMRLPLYKTILILILYIILVYINTKGLVLSVDMKSSRYNNGILYLINGVLGTIAFYNIFNILSKKNILIKLKKILEYFSINGITYMCTNQFIIRILNYIMLARYSTGILNALFYIIVLILTLISCYVVNEVLSRSGLKKVIGK